MEKITVKKTDLMAKLTANRERHRKIFLEALEGYRQELLSLLEAHIDHLKSDKIPPHVVITLERPEDHTRDYDRVIAMLQMDVHPEVLLSEADFAQFAQDDWRWKRAWGIANSGYVSGATQTAAVDYFEDA